MGTCAWWGGGRGEGKVGKRFKSILVYLYVFFKYFFYIFLKIYIYIIFYTIFLRSTKGAWRKINIGTNVYIIIIIIIVVVVAVIYNDGKVKVARYKERKKVK
ncbi:hypothetical protein, unlikely [Trypanosoma brucei gambiense DAL972]|uniref:Uncharacterized protein n=1 Tax=Trypanosoma brucei gambiense (strain MHOM/CI/86/DAL972) TaxID=679716 RepID=C9ZZC1_TRYB9|nr:hypothetical protein, unlikely [Trypanosoma brucei gambiense DAL972]CBH14770.1 hypothetical protein, unlikely [Trypanosoma brucei gambiense DAL972]|eukprot:XP_011777036.1 hypothetical protein, unlikely [Trypanosoma brucei gambiense DAL972]